MILKKLLLTITCVVLPLTAWAGSNSAFINSAIILKEAPQAIEASKAMQTEFQGRETSLRTLLATIKEQEERYNKDSAIMSESKRKKAEEDILAKKREFRFSQQSLKEDVQIRRKEAIRSLQKTISGIITAYGKKKGYDFIFSEGVAYAADSVNITNEILEQLKKQ